MNIDAAVQTPAVQKQTKLYNVVTDEHICVSAGTDSNTKDE